MSSTRKHKRAGALEKVEEVRKQCEDNEQLLKDLVRGRYGPSRNYSTGGLRFVVARRWNSWYPSYFDVEGGCYAVIPGDVDFEDAGNREDKRIGVTVVDPGFRFIEIMRREYHVEPQDITTVVVTHFHPDHMAGLIEFATIKRTSKLPCSLYVNSTMYRTFRDLEDPFISIKELGDGQIQELMRYRAVDGKHVRLSVKGVRVHHGELGNQHASLGLRLKISLCPTEDMRLESREDYLIGILGDTDGNADYIPEYVTCFKDVDLLVVHLGTFSDKKLGRGGKHLYLSGVRDVLDQLGTALLREGFAETLSRGKTAKRIVILSEFGLELASHRELYEQLRAFVRSYSWRLPLLFGENYLSSLAEDAEATHDPYRQLLKQFLASGAVDTLARVKSGTSGQSLAYPPLSELEARELVVALALQAIPVVGTRSRDGIDKLASAMESLAARSRSAQAGSGPAYSAYVEEVARVIGRRALQTRLDELYADLIANASYSSVLGDTEHLRRCCYSLVRDVIKNFEDPARISLYLSSIREIMEYARARRRLNIALKEKSSWAYDDFATVDTLRRFWAIALASLCSLYRATENSVPSTAPENACCRNLLEIGNYYATDITEWGNLLVGDIGCTLGIHPFRVSGHGERVPGARLRSADGQWIDPCTAESFYSADGNRISYRPTSRASSGEHALVHGPGTPSD